MPIEGVNTVAPRVSSGPVVVAVFGGAVSGYFAERVEGCGVDEGEPAQFQFFSGSGVWVGVHAGGLVHGVCSLGVGYWLLLWARATARIMMARVSAISMGVVIIWCCGDCR